MSGWFTILMILAMLAVLASLGLGLVALAQGGEVGRKYSNRLMRLRVALQAAAIGLFVLAVITAAGS